MNIVPILNFNNFQSVHSIRFKPPGNNPCANCNCKLDDKINNVIFFAGSLINYEPLSSKRPDYKPFDCDYSDVKDFSLKFSDKINSQLLNPTEKDLDKLIDEIKIKTNAPNDMILNVLFRLTSFSSYSSLKNIEDFLNENKLKINKKEDGLFNINDVLNYVCNIKFDFESRDDYCSYSCLFLDDMLLNSLEKYEQENVFKTGSYTKNSYKKFVILDGSNIKFKNGKYYSCDFLSGNGYLKELAIYIIQKMQSGMSLDMALNGDIEKRFLKLYPKEKDNIIILKSKMPQTDLKKEILANLQSKTINPNMVERNVQIYSGFYNKNLSQKDLMQYFNNNSFAFSPTSLALEMKKKYLQLKNISNKTGRKNLYYVPNPLKSYSIITYMFCKVNGIKNEDIISKIPDDLENKNIIILDDISISGESLEKITKEIKPKNADLFYFAPLLSSGAEKSSINIVPSRTIKNDLDCSKIKGKSYQNSNTSIFLPYMLPDNNSNIASNLFSKMLYKITNNSAKFFH